MNELELKPCPFCGSAAEIQETDYIQGEGIYDLRAGWAVFCTGNSCMPTASYGGNDFLSYGYETKEEAAAAWNKRTQ